jgi:TPR repeat protein
MRYHRELVEPEDFERVLEIFTISAESGDRVAMNNLGIFYQFDSLKMGIQDSVKAFEWRQRSAEAGYVGAMRGLADMYLSGDGCECDAEKSLEWLLKAADAKDETAMRKIGVKYMGGTRLGRDFSKAKALMESVLEKNPDDVHASRLLARMYRDGIGTGENAVLSKKWYLSPIGMLNRKAEAEDVNKMDDLADYYKNGWGVEKDLKRAIELYEKPASTGIAASMSSLNNIYRFNAKSKEDIAKADEWARKYIERQTQKGGGAARGVADSCVGVGN